MSAPTGPLGERSVNVPPPNANPPDSKKRKSDGNDNAIDPDDIELDPYFASSYTANQIRTKIRQFINSKEMKVGEFQDKLGIGAGSYSRFMSQKGPQKGLESDTFLAAAEFFKRRELAGVKMPKANKKAKTASDKDATGTDTPANAKASSKKGTSSAEADDVDVSDIHLEGEDTDSVPVYDTCDDIRTKITRLMRDSTSAGTNAAFVRLIKAALRADSATNPTSRQMPTFQNKKGPTSGADSPVFYASYVFFEKLRVKKNKPKSKKRLEMEKVWKKDGFRLEDAKKQTFTLLAGETVKISSLGEVDFR